MPADALVRGVRQLGAGTLNAVARIGYAARFFISVLTHSPQALWRFSLDRKSVV